MQITEVAEHRPEGSDLMVLTVAADARLRRPRRYAGQMVQLLDPSGAAGLNADRVIAKEDSTATNRKVVVVVTLVGSRVGALLWPRHLCLCRQDLDVVLGPEGTTLIVDDSPGVWPAPSRRRVLVPRRYHFFDSSAKRDATARTDVGYFGAGGEEPEAGGQLDALLGVLRRIHAHFFDALAAAPPEAAPALDVSASVNAVRRQVLAALSRLPYMATFLIWQVLTDPLLLEQRQSDTVHLAFRDALVESQDPAFDVGIVELLMDHGAKSSEVHLP